MGSPLLLSITNLQVVVYMKAGPTVLSVLLAAPRSEFQLTVQLVLLSDTKTERLVVEDRKN